MYPGTQATLNYLCLLFWKSAYFSLLPVLFQTIFFTGFQMCVECCVTTVHVVLLSVWGAEGSATVYKYHLLTTIALISK
jgi:hypothetical protein